MKKGNVTKKIAVLVMTAIMAMGLIACGKKDKDDSGQTSVTSETSTSKESKKEETSTSKEENKDPKFEGHDWPFISESLGLKYVAEVYNKCEDLTEWGSYKDFVTRDNHMYIKYPSLIPTSTNHVAYQTDPTVAMFDYASENSYTDEITDLESILKVSIENGEEFGSPIYWMKDYWNIYTDGYVTMSISSTELETIGQYDCCKYIGTATHAGDYDKTEITTQFVAYSAYTKNGNEPFYWMVFDVSEDQSLGSTIADYAKKMGYTIVEDPKDY
ncbi:hypothetical protein SAMN02910339_01649 [Lachnospiraceae bacterium YSD2013]|nr:hypothetical protein SAMN02910339_01649 [Lachnospiraceae bacterium YSD2013]